MIAVAPSSSGSMPASRPESSVARDPALYQPQPTRWGQVWRFGACVLISALAWGSVIERQWVEQSVRLWVDPLVGVLAYVVVVRRRRWPLGVAIATSALSMVSGVAAGPAALAIVSLATRRQLWPLVTIAMVSTASGFVFEATQPARTDPLPWWANLTTQVIATAALIGWGLYAGSRRELLWTLRERADRAEAEQVLRLERAQGEERSRIAREMHDVVAHRISQVSMHAGALAYRSDLSAEQVREQASIIEDAARAALVELRAVLGVLREPGGSQGVERPQPTYADIGELVDAARSVGARVEVIDAVAAQSVTEPVPLPEAVGRTIYRVVQEALTNAGKHAPGAAVRLLLSGSVREGVTIDVSNPLPIGGPVDRRGAPVRQVTPSGFGLVGMAERVALLGGRLEHGVSGGVFTLTVWLPWPAVSG